MIGIGTIPSRVVDETDGTTQVVDMDLVPVDPDTHVFGTVAVTATARRLLRCPGFLLFEDVDPLFGNRLFGNRLFLHSTLEDRTACSLIQIGDGSIRVLVMEASRHGSATWVDNVPVLKKYKKPRPCSFPFPRPFRPARNLYPWTQRVHDALVRATDARAMVRAAEAAKQHAERVQLFFDEVHDVTVGVSTGRSASPEKVNLTIRDVDEGLVRAIAELLSRR